MIGLSRPAPPTADGYATVDSQSRVLVPPRLRRQLLDERRDERQRQDACGQVEGEDTVPPVAAPSKGGRPARRGRIRLYDPQQARAALAALPPPGRGNDRSALDRAQLTRLAEGEPSRRIARPAAGVEQRLQALRARFPNFCHVLDEVERALALARHARLPPVVAPMCLVGEPGVGKSFFVEELAAEVLNVKVHRVQVETSSVAETLVGTARHWSTSGPGELFDALVRGEVINPLLMLDELDKAPRRSDHATLPKVLYALLEPASARCFRDASVPEVALDASYVQWIATANRIEPIAAPLRSRLRVFHIPAPTPEQAQAIVRTQDAQLRTEYKLRHLPPLPQDMLERLCRQSPRRVRQTLRALLGAMVARGATAFGAQEREVLRAELHRAAQDDAAGAQVNHAANPTTLVLQFSRRDDEGSGPTGAPRVLH